MHVRVADTAVEHFHADVVWTEFPAFKNMGLEWGKSVDVLKGARFGRDNNDCNYIETADGTRLYISTTEPTGDIPEGSIGIGW